ncbi:MAG: hypothetical protein IJP13_02250 [Lachnospiraceae bacterium]|nr:hypothetical protein [Lachnospiraceae bacterium]
MGFLSKLERKIGKYAIPNLIKYLLVAYVIGYVTLLIDQRIYNYLILDPELVCRGQVWRLFTWICTIPQQLDIFVIFMFMLYYWIGTTLERYWGTFRYNMYIFSGWFFMTVGAMLIYLITELTTGNGISLPMETYYINMASFLAFATIFPDMQLMFMMMIPIKIKWLAIADLIILAYDFFSNLSVVLKHSPEQIAFLSMGRVSSEMYIAACASIVISILNFILFYFLTKKGRSFSPSEVKRKRQYKRQVNEARGITKHKCAICGRTENDGEGLVFRFCSRCEGNYEYCQDHLFTHEHVGAKKEEE